MAAWAPDDAWDEAERALDQAKRLRDRLAEARDERRAYTPSWLRNLKLFLGRSTNG